MAEVGRRVTGRDGGLKLALIGAVQASLLKKLFVRWVRHSDTQQDVWSFHVDGHDWCVSLEPGPASVSIPTYPKALAAQWRRLAKEQPVDSSVSVVLGGSADSRAWTQVIEGEGAGKWLGSALEVLPDSNWLQRLKALISASGAPARSLSLETTTDTESIWEFEVADSVFGVRVKTQVHEHD